MNGFEYTVKFECIDENEFDLQVLPGYTIHKVKSLICNSKGIPIDHQNIFYNGRMLEDEHTLFDYGIKSCGEHLSLRYRGDSWALLVQVMRTIVTFVR